VADIFETLSGLDSDTANAAADMVATPAMNNVRTLSKMPSNIKMKIARPPPAWLTYLKRHLSVLRKITYFIRFVPLTMRLVLQGAGRRSRAAFCGSAPLRHFRVKRGTTRLKGTAAENSAAPPLSPSRDCEAGNGLLTRRAQTEVR
jgi:hypothetical protein